MAQRRTDIHSSGQDDLGVAQVEQPFLAGALEHILGQRQMPPPGWDRCFQLAIL
ncbi:hypothetical protein D3C84_1310640 [compost metagenome]